MRRRDNHPLRARSRGPDEHQARLHPGVPGAVDLLVFVSTTSRSCTRSTIRIPPTCSARPRVREKTLKREYFATLPEGSAAGAVVAYWSPSLKSWNLWENVKTCVARGLRLARDYRHVRIGVAMNTAEAAPLIGKVAEGAILGAYTFDRYKQEKDEFLQKEAQLVVLVHPDHQADAEARKARYAWVAENVNLARDLINEPATSAAGVHRGPRAEVAKEWA